MSDFSNANKQADPASISVWPTAMRYGGILSLALIVLGLVMHLAGLSDPANPSPLAQVVNCLNYIAIIVVVVLAIKAHRDKDLGGFISMGRGIGVGTATSLVIGAITAIWMIVFMKLIDPTMSEVIMDSAMEKAQPGQEEMTEKMVGLFSNPFILAAMVLLGTVIIGFVTALIGSAVMKRDTAPNI